MDEYREDNPVTVFDLQSIVMVRAKKGVTEDGEYVTFVKREVREDSNNNFLWVKFQKGKHEVVLPNDFLDSKKVPQIAIYQMLPSMPPVPEQDVTKVQNPGKAEEIKEQKMDAKQDKSSTGELMKRKRKKMKKRNPVVEAQK